MFSGGGRRAFFSRSDAAGLPALEEDSPKSTEQLCTKAPPEDTGTAEPWDADLTGDVLLVVGGEHDGIPDSILDASDLVIRVPMAGFVPSYNLQAPMAVVATEALRQRSS